MVITTVGEKKAALEERAAEQKNLGRYVDRLVSQGQRDADSAELGCDGQGVCPLLGRAAARALGLRAKVHSGVEVEIAPAQQGLGAASSARTLGNRFVGVKKSHATPSVKLEKASAAMRRRVELLEERAKTSREAAAQSMKAGQKAAALRELRRAKMVEKQLGVTQGALDALDVQADLIEQTSIQHEVAEALGETAKTLKKNKKLVARAEEAVDASNDVKDLHDDLSQVMSTLGETVAAEFDEDELLEELNALVKSDVPPRDDCYEAEREAERDVREACAAAVALEEKHASYDALEQARRDIPNVPVNGKKNKIERQALLSN
jgi:hypothetical protein